MYNNRVTLKEAGAERHMLAERRREAREQALATHNASLPPMNEARRRKPETGQPWLPKWMRKG